MPGFGYAGQIAQSRPGQAQTPSTFGVGQYGTPGQTNNQINLNSAQPWTYTYQGTSSPGAQEGLAPMQAGNEHLQNGPSGYGWYQTNTPAQNALGAQQYFTNQFNQNMGTMQNQMGNQMAGQVGAQADQSVQAARSHNASRGLLYGGVNAGQEAGIRGNAAAQTAQGQSNINQGLLQEQSQLNAGAIQSGINYQQTQQQMQQALYQNAAQGLATDTAATNGLLQAAGTVAMVAML